jgi:mxaK protein
VPELALHRFCAAPGSPIARTGRNPRRSSAIEDIGQLGGTHSRLCAAAPQYASGSICWPPSAGLLLLAPATPAWRSPSVRRQVGLAWAAALALRGCRAFVCTARLRTERADRGGQASAAPPIVAALGVPLEVRFATAWVAAQRGELTRAVALYREVAQARPDLAGAALYDAGNALMREGNRIAATGDWVGARPLIELAKETYREALRRDPGRWDARYNLERALRAAPEEEDDRGEPVPMGGESERSVTTMRAFTLGLP